MPPKILNDNPRRSKRMAGIELSSDVGLKTHRKPKKTVVADNENMGKEPANMNEVLGDDLFDDGEEVQQPVHTEGDIEDEDVQVATNEEVAEEDDISQPAEEGNVPPSTETVTTQQSESKKRRTRGPTRMRKVAKHLDDKLDIEFASIGEHVGDGSVTLSSFLGVLVRERVPVLLDDWRHLPTETRDMLWEEIQGRFNLSEDWHRDCVFKQMCCDWRSAKSKLSTLIRSTNSKSELLSLKPSNIQSVTAWMNWVKNRKSTKFKEISDKMSKMRKEQIPQTTSRKGLVRLAHEMKKESSNPEMVTRSKIWLAGHTHKDGRPVRPEFAETIEKIKTIDSEMGSSSTTNIKEDAVSQVLGKDRPGRIRGMGRGVTATKLAFLLARDSHVADLRTQIKELQHVVSGLAGKKVQSEDGNKTESSSLSKGVRCQILDWCSEDDVVVGEGELCSVDPVYKIGRVPIGPNAAAIIVKSVSVEEASVWRPSETVYLLSQAVGTKISWPAVKVITDTDTWSVTQKNTTYSSASDASLRKIFITDWNFGETVVAEGRLCSSDPKELFNNIPIGPNAAIVKIDKVIDKKAPVWRPSETMLVMADALHENITWSLNHVHEMKTPSMDESADKRISPPRSISNSTGSTNKSVKKKCILLDCNNSGQTVAEGKLFSSNPEDKIHNAPLGPNASKVWVENIKVGAARLWRSTPEFQTIADTLGTIVAWPNDKLKFV